MNIAQEHEHITPRTRILMSIDTLCLVSIYHYKNTFYKIINYWFYIRGEADKNILIYTVYIFKNGMPVILTI